MKTNKNQHRGRIQAQGGKVEKSVAWAQNLPPTVQEGFTLPGRLKSKLTKKEVTDRKKGFAKAESFIG